VARWLGSVKKKKDAPTKEDEEEAGRVSVVITEVLHEKKFLQIILHDSGVSFK
jgi:hypothetical protein